MLPRGGDRRDPRRRARGRRAPGIVRAANRPVRKYLGLRSGPARAGARGRARATRRSPSSREAAARLGADGRHALRRARAPIDGVSLRLRVAVRPIRSDGAADRPRDPAARDLARAAAAPLRGACCRRSVARDGFAAAAAREGAAAARARCAARSSDRRRIAGMAELGERISRTQTAIEYWLAVDDALVREDYPDAQLLRRAHAHRDVALAAAGRRARARARRSRGASRPTTSRARIRAARPLTPALRAAAAGRPAAASSRIERLGRPRFRFTYAFHAREVRFEREPAPTASSRSSPRRSRSTSQRHDPVELLPPARGPLVGPAPDRRRDATRRDARGADARAFSRRLPGYLESILDQLEREGRLSGAASVRVHADVGGVRAVRSRASCARRSSRRTRSCAIARFHLRKLVWRAAWALVRERVGPSGSSVAARRRRGGAPRLCVDSPSAASSTRSRAASDDEVAPLRAGARRARLPPLARGRLPRRGERRLRERGLALRRAARARCCARRERRSGGGACGASRDLSPFLRRAGQSRLPAHAARARASGSCASTTCHHAAAVIRPRGATCCAAAAIATRRPLAGIRRRATTSLAIALLALPFLGAAFAYERAPLFFDAAASCSMARRARRRALVSVGTASCWKKDLTFFHASVPRIGGGHHRRLPAGVPDRRGLGPGARSRGSTLGSPSALMGSTTLLYLYVEVQRRTRRPERGLRARASTSSCSACSRPPALGLDRSRACSAASWSRATGAPRHAELDRAAARARTPPFVGQLPRIIGHRALLRLPDAPSC